MDMLPNGAARLESNQIDTMMGDTSHHHHMEHGGDTMSMMKMYFHYGLGDLVLFKGFTMDTNTKLILTSLVLFSCGVLLELIDYSRGYLSCRCRANIISNPVQANKAGLVAPDPAHHLLLIEKTTVQINTVVRIELE